MKYKKKHMWNTLQVNQGWNYNLAFVYELGVTVVVAFLTWGIGVGGLELVAWEASGIALSGIERIYLLFAAPFFLGIMSYFLVKWSRDYKGPGELITLLKQKSSEFPGWIRATITWVIACIELGTGLSPKGFEGPYLTTAGGLSGWFASKLYLDNEARKRLARCGLGVAFGVLFRTPLGGFICTFEFGLPFLGLFLFLPYHQRSRGRPPEFGGFEKAAFRKQLLPAIVATFVSYLLTTTTGLPTPFEVISLPPIVTRTQFLLLLVVGLSCGIAALFYVFAIRIAKQTFKRLQKQTPLVLIPVMGATVSTLLGGLFPIILGSNDLSRVISSSPTIPLILLGAIVAKIVATAAADGSNCAGGTVGPAILLGGLVGELVGGLNPIFATAGSAALIGPIAGLPFTMLLTAVTWLGFTPAAWLIIVPILLSQMVCWGIELYPYDPNSRSLIQFLWDQLAISITIIGNNTIFRSQIAKRLPQEASQQQSLIQLKPTETESPPEKSLVKSSSTLLTSPTKTVIAILYYSQEDKAMLLELFEFFQQNEKIMYLSIKWDMIEIRAESEWAKENNTQLSKADIVLVLISQHFIASDYWYNSEMAHSLERHRKGEARVIPIILHDSTWKETPLHELQALPEEGRPIINWSDQKEAFSDVAMGIQNVVDGFISNNASG
jgi:H+/Cl- antiporter ClcA